MDANAAYVRFRCAPVAQTKRFADSENVLVDVDAQDHLIGIEIIGLQTDIPIEKLSQAFGFSENTIYALKEIQYSLHQGTVISVGSDGGLSTGTLPWSKR